MADKPPEGLGRAGRGALLLAALKNQPRRPGQDTAGETSQPSDILEQKCIGRGALLKALSRGRAVSTAEEPPKIIGRGRGLAITSILGGIGRGQPKSEPSAEIPVAAPSPPSPTSSVTSQVEELCIGKYKGTSGAELKLQVNYVRLKILENKGIYEYHVSFSPEVESQKMKFRLMNDPSVRDIIGSVKTFDGSKLYLPRKLPNMTEVTVQLPTDGTAITVCVKYVKTCKPKDCLHLYNLLFRKLMRILNMTQVGRNYFDPMSSMLVPQHRLEVWPGYVTAVQEYEGGVMLNCDASFRVLRTVTARDIMHEASRMAGKGDPKESMAKALLGAVVLTRYNNKTYRVDDIAWDMTATSTFPTHDGSNISFVDYYKRAYDLTIQDTNQPLLVSKARRRAGDTSGKDQLLCLIPEFCFLTGLTDAMRGDFKVMKDIAQHTRVTPERRQLALQKFIDNIRRTPEARDCLAAWNLVLDPSPVNCDGRLLKTETLLFGGDVKVTVSPEADWGRQAVSNRVLVPVNLEKWAVVFTRRDAPRVADFIKMLRSVCPAMGILVKEPIRAEILSERTETYCEAIKEVVDPTVQIVVIVFPTARDDRYSAVKKLCCVEMPVPSQVIQAKTIGHPQKLRSVVQKVALQMNCKLGGELWSVHIPIENLMVCGMDTYHDASQGKKSVLAFVASINSNRTRWFSMTTTQRPGQEAGDSLKMLFISALRKYFEVNHRLPDKVVLFRDGVGDGMLDFIVRHEVEQLTSCYKHFSADYSPALSVVVVQKRTNTRLYAAGGRGPSNPLPGSILDHSITRKGWYDYFLVSQHVRQGTVSPTHYVVVHDTSALKPEHMQRLTYKMTHLYYNWPGTVRVPAPCQYAHKLAYLVGQSIHRETHCDLADRLFYL